MMGVAFDCGRSQRAQANAGRMHKPVITWDSNPQHSFYFIPLVELLGKNVEYPPPRFTFNFVAKHPRVHYY